MNFLDTNIPPLGMGCWPIGGAMYAGAQSHGYSGADDETSLRTIQTALDGGITLFDTAIAYGAGHSERLLGQALKGHPDTIIVTKIGVGIDEASRQLSFGPFRANDVIPAIEGSLRRLQRDRIDVVLLHLNELPIADAEPIFDALEDLSRDGKIRSYGWSTDYPERAAAFAARPRFSCVEFAMNLFQDAPGMRNVTECHDLCALIRSPLAMGLLSGKYNADTEMPGDDIRASDAAWMSYFSQGRPNADFLRSIEAVRELLTTGGRSMVQGALGWVWAKDSRNIPIPGAKTPEQMAGLTRALEKDPLPAAIMAEIDALLQGVEG